MKQKIFTIYDEKATAYLAPFFLPTQAMAQRTFGECANSTDHQFGKHSADYTLFEIGEFDDSTGTIELYEAKTNLGNALEFKTQTIQTGQQDLPLATNGN